MSMAKCDRNHNNRFQGFAMEDGEAAAAKGGTQRSSEPPAAAAKKRRASMSPSPAPRAPPTPRKSTRTGAAAAAASAAASATACTAITTTAAATAASSYPAAVWQSLDPRAAPKGGAKGVLPKLGPGAPLRLVVCGHNPSETAWQRGHYYAHRSNHMWRLLNKVGLTYEGAPPGAEADDEMPTRAGIGFTDVGQGVPGTLSSAFSAEDFARWADPFFERLRAHMRVASASIGCTCGECGAPCVLAFAGKRQFLELLNIGSPRVATVPYGPQTLRPAGWPLPASRTEVWVLTSTSGAAAMTNAAREAPYAALAERVRGVAWPRNVVPMCRASSAKSE